MKQRKKIRSPVEKNTDAHKFFCITLLKIIHTDDYFTLPRIRDKEKKQSIPWFPTKPNGQGIGLLFIREGLMRHHCQFSLKTYKDGLYAFSDKNEIKNGCSLLRETAVCYFKYTLITKECCRAFSVAGSAPCSGSLPAPGSTWYVSLSAG